MTQTLPPTTDRAADDLSDVTATFRGNLINSSDQLAGVGYTNSFRCVGADVGGMGFPICVYAAEDDVWVSASFVGGGYWERPVVERVVRLLRRYPDVGLVDLGANVGTFALPAARLTDVVAVEPYSESMARLFESVRRGGVQTNVSLVMNAVSDRRSVSALGFHRGNLGGTYLKTPNSTDCRRGRCTRTVVLDDLLPLVRRRRVVMKVGT